MIWEVFPDQNNKNNKTSPFSFNENWQTQSTTYTKKEDNTYIRVEVFWHDNEEVDTILDLNECIITVKKEFPGR
ncbi:hypothetical protein [Peribacillus huizhouensis]|uniref:Uncharacterized protein n=1 Tax=Peribacillus huizhouensis TaxID=1501239 RepID=A0ABR6CWM6_9BACI|nr:hypothetical protein [Peribacillus huizhouensis]MBA9029429.1 hypothetical protein [Peribacillus huizhouensis]